MKFAPREQMLRQAEILEIHYPGKPKWQTGIYVTFRKHFSMALLFPLWGSSQPLFFASSHNLRMIASNRTLLLQREISDFHGIWEKVSGNYILKLKKTPSEHQACRISCPHCTEVEEQVKIHVGQIVLVMKSLEVVLEDRRSGLTDRGSGACVLIQASQSLRGFEWKF